jgi:hypothetical protein
MKYLVLCLLTIFATIAKAQVYTSIAKEWNEKLLFAISTDFARPTIAARNLFHISAAMYDAWAVYDQHADTYLLGKTVNGYTCPLMPFSTTLQPRAAQEEALSFAAYRMIRQRFAPSPGAPRVYYFLDEIMKEHGYDPTIVSEDYRQGPAQMGNYIAAQYLAYGLQDGSNEAKNHLNTYYQPSNPPLPIDSSGNAYIRNLNRWQPLQFNVFIDQSGNIFQNVTPAFQAPEWGNVSPFALQEKDAKTFHRDGQAYKVYHNPGPPIALDLQKAVGLSEEFKWGYALVSIWSALLDEKDKVMIDISPRGMGNNSYYPIEESGYRQFYDLFNGGDRSPGHQINPKTGQAYQAQMVLRGDFYRVLAEYWADGPNSVTPPGHWFSLFNYINENPALVRKIGGQGPELDHLEWEVKGYFALGGAMHDAAISAWSIKGYYDGSRPVTTIRGMAALGQSSDPKLPHYHPGGLPLVPGYIELIRLGDSLAGPNNKYVNEIKLKAWRGPKYVKNPRSEVAGVGWIRAAEWHPYQRPTFVSPPFAGYVSGHSTYSRAAAEVLTAFTGDPFFPGGLARFGLVKNEYLVFEDGPSEHVTLEWATYFDAADQCSLSRIYGGIHAPMDDIPGRIIGMKVGKAAFAFAKNYFEKSKP